MIDLKLIKYRLIGVADIDRTTNDEDSVIDIVSETSASLYFYKVISGKVVNKYPGETGYFYKGCRLHAYCVPVGMGKNLLPDLKDGDYIISREKGSRAWRYYSEHYKRCRTEDMSDMRYATIEEVAKCTNPVDTDKSRFITGDIVVGKEALGLVLHNSIIKVKKNDGYVYSDDFRESWQNYKEENFRYATPMEIDAYKNGYKYLASWKHWLEVEVMRKFPSPASFTDVFGRKYINISYEYPRWEHEKLTLLPDGAGVVYYLGQWATPAPHPIELYCFKKEEEEMGWKRYFTQGLSIQHFRPQSEEIEETKESICFPTNITGKEFNEDDFLSNPINQRMSLPMKETRKQPIHERIHF